MTKSTFSAKLSDGLNRREREPIFKYARLIEHGVKTMPQSILASRYHEIVSEVSTPILEGLPKTGFAASVIIPLHNEEEILVDLVTKLIEEFSEFPFQTELLLCENGSQDRTREIAARLSTEHENVHLVTINKPSYGGALKMGIREAHADLIVIFNADLWSKQFFVDAVLLMQNGCDIVIGSKRLVASKDHRPLLRRAITASFNIFLKFAFGFKGTDTHGMKTLRRSHVEAVMERCYTVDEVFDTELVLKAQHAGLRICEIPMEVSDTRPARLSLLKRIPSTLRDLWTIRVTM